MQIKTVETTAEEYAIKFDRKYPYVWLKNMGDSDVYISDKAGITAEGDGVSKLNAGESMMVYSLDDSVYVLGATTIEAHGQEFADSPFGDTVISGGSPSPTPPEPSVTVEPLTANQNGVYTAPEGTAYSPVTVDVDVPEPVITPLSVNENGTYNAPTGVDGYSPVTVSVSGIHIGIVDETAYVGDITIL